MINKLKKIYETNCLQHEAITGALAEQHSKIVNFVFSDKIAKKLQTDYEKLLLRRKGKLRRMILGWVAGALVVVDGVGGRGHR